MKIASLFISLVSILLSITTWIWFKVAFVSPVDYWWTSIWFGLGLSWTALVLAFFVLRSPGGIIAFIVAIPTVGYILVWIWLSYAL